MAILCNNPPAMLHRWFASSSAALWLMAMASLVPSAPTQASRYESRSGDLVFSIDDATGAYALDDGALHFGADLPTRPVHVTKVAGVLRFDLAPNIEARVAPAPGHASALLFSWTNIGPEPVKNPPAFPDFTKVPAGLHSLSHRNEDFAPPVFDNPQNVSTPWLLFRNSGPAVVLSPVSDVFLASMLGDARTRVAVGTNAEVRSLPPGFTARALVAAAPSIVAAYDAWGAALRAIYSRGPAAADADPTLRYIGVLTDNAGGHYYYNYDFAEGLNYEESLVRFVARSRAAGLPFGWLQLDSWWYPKSSWNPQEKTNAIKNPALPAQAWNRYGGLLEWKADPGVFPSGMAAFHERVRLPFLAHNRFIDRDSPYRQRFAVSGLAGIDRGYWTELASYASHSGVATYLQDWLSAIYNFSPELHSIPGKGAAFTDGMASSMAARGITMQYCMPYPLHILQGARYPNLTTIRAAGDGLTRSKWTQLAFNARLIREVGAWPATDVMPSRDSAAMLFATLSAGPVGVGDAFEQLDRTNFFKVARADGEVVKPDEPLAPLAQSYVSQARRTGEPILASTSTRHGGHTTAYLLAFADNPQSGRSDFSFSPAELGFRDRVAVYDPQSQTLVTLNATDTFSGNLTGPDAYAYRIIAPVSRSGVALIGDLDKFVPMGRKRIFSYRDVADGAVLGISYAANERGLTIAGYAASPVTARAEGASIESIARDAKTGLFKVKLKTGDRARRRVILILGLKNSRTGQAWPRSRNRSVNHGTEVSNALPPAIRSNSITRSSSRRSSS